MGAAVFRECTTRVGAPCCVEREAAADRPILAPKGGASPLADELQEELRVNAERERILNVVEEEDSGARIRLQRFYSCLEIEEVENFMSEFKKAPGPFLSRSHSLLNSGCGPWGIASERGGDKNAWDGLDTTAYAVRGPSYLKDRRKQSSGLSMTDLLVVDLFLCSTDIQTASQCQASKTVERLRRDGERRRLFVLNFRLVPLHVVVVWALPPSSEADDTPAVDLLERFFHKMSDEERNRRLKVIPKIVTGPWVVRRLIGENHPAILGRGIPVDYFESEGVLEASVGVASSSAAQRVAKAMLRAGSALAMEVALVVEGQSEQELPEQILGGFSIHHANLTNLREVSKMGTNPSPKAADGPKVTFSGPAAETQGSAPSPASLQRPVGLPPLSPN